MGKDVKQIIKDRIEDIVTNFVYYDRKEDEYLSIDNLNDCVKSGEFTIDEIVAEFRKHLENTFKN